MKDHKSSRIAVIGTGYVGLVTGTCLADVGNMVDCYDSNATKIDLLNAGQVPIYEPHLGDLIEKNRRKKRLAFRTDIEGVAEAQFVILAVGTPAAEDGTVDLNALSHACRDVSPYLDDAVVIVKSTVPVGTNANLSRFLHGLTGRDIPVVSNPEFLREGSAINDFFHADRIIIGSRRQEEFEGVKALHGRILREAEAIRLSPESAELTKEATNAFLATKISFINEIANLCEKVGANVDEVALGMGMDRRIGYECLRAGPGYGGSCFPKDVAGLLAVARAVHEPLRIIHAATEANARQRGRIREKVFAMLGNEPRGKTAAIWGLAFKPNTDDVRCSPALALCHALIAAGVNLRLHDPEAMDNARAELQPGIDSHVAMCRDHYEAAEGADLLILATEWQLYANPDWQRIAAAMKQPRIVDCRNLYQPGEVIAAGFAYDSVGRPNHAN